MNKKKALPIKKSGKKTVPKKVELDVDQLKGILSKYHTKDCWNQTKIGSILSARILKKGFIS
jgi:hypothetical protein